MNPCHKYKYIIGSIFYVFSKVTYVVLKSEHSDWLVFAERSMNVTFVRSNTSVSLAVTTNWVAYIRMQVSDPFVTLNGGYGTIKSVASSCRPCFCTMSKLFATFNKTTKKVKKKVVCHQSQINC